MEKTVLFGINAHSGYQNTGQLQTHFCPNCMQLQKQLNQLHLQLEQRSQRNTQEGNSQSTESQTMKLLQIQLEDIKQKYLTFRKKVKLIEKENQSLFQENTKLQKELQECRQRLRALQNHNGPHLHQKSAQQAQRIQQAVSNEKESKKLQIQVFVWRQKTEKLEVLLKNQSEEVGRLKELLKKRNNLQEERHKLLSDLL